MTEIIIEYIDGTEPEKIVGNYSKPKEGWLQIAEPNKKDEPRKQRFIPAHRIKNVFTTDFGTIKYGEENQ